MVQRGKSGVAQYVFALVQELLPYADQHAFSLLVLEDDRPLFAFAEGKMRIVPVAERWRPAIRNIVWHQVVLPKWLKRNRIDVVHVPSYRRMIRFAPCAKVATIHDLAPFQVDNKYDPARMFYGRVVVKHLARHQQAIVAVSSNTADDISHFFKIPLSRIQVILNGVDHTRFNPGRSAATVGARERWGISQPFFFYVSRLEHPGKNHVRLIEAFNIFKESTGSNWQLVFGGSDWHGAERIHAVAKESPFAADIRSLGFVPDDALPDLYRAAGALVYPSLFEGFGLPPVEAMACGCPVISSARGSLDEVIGDAALRIEPEDVGSITEALAKTASDSRFRAELEELGIANAARFDWRENAAHMMNVYERALTATEVSTRTARATSGLSTPAREA